jgi:hypothetical protein
MACKGSGVQIPSAPPQVRGSLRRRPPANPGARAADTQQPLVRGRCARPWRRSPRHHRRGRLPMTRPMGLPPAPRSRRPPVWPISSSITREGMAASSSQVAKELTHGLALLMSLFMHLLDGPMDLVPAVVRRLRALELVPEEVLPTMADVLTAAALGQSPLGWRRAVGESTRPPSIRSDPLGRTPHGCWPTSLTSRRTRRAQPPSSPTASSPSCWRRMPGDDPKS